MRKNSYIFTAILAIVVSTGAWADAPTSNTERANGTVHDVYKPTDLADSGIAGVTYVNRVGEMAGAAAAAAEAHAADASKSAYAAQSSADDADTKAGAAAAAAAAAQSSADAAAAAANSITNGNGITIDISETGKKKITVQPKDNAGISVSEDGVAVKAGNGIDLNEGNVNVTPGVGIEIDNDTVAVKAGKGIDLNEGNVNVTPGDGIKIDNDTVAVKAGKGIDVDANGIAVKAGTGIVVDANGVAVDGAGVTTLGGMYAPVTAEEYMQTLTEIVNNGGDIYNVADQRTVALTVPLATELAAQGTLSGAYSTIAEADADFKANKTDVMKVRPLSAWANLEGQAAERDTIMAASDVSYVNMPDGMDSEKESHAVGDATRPVYVADAETDGKHSGVVTPIQSVAIPVGGENFAEEITSANVAKIWIQ